MQTYNAVSLFASLLCLRTSVQFFQKACVYSDPSLILMHYEVFAFQESPKRDQICKHIYKWKSSKNFLSLLAVQLFPDIQIYMPGFFVLNKTLCRACI